MGNNKSSREVESATDQNDEDASKRIIEAFFRDCGMSFKQAAEMHRKCIEEIPESQVLSVPSLTDLLNPAFFGEFEKSIVTNVKLFLPLKGLSELNIAAALKSKGFKCVKWPYGVNGDILIQVHTLKDLKMLMVAKRCPPLPVMKALMDLIDQWKYGGVQISDTGLHSTSLVGLIVSLSYYSTFNTIQDDTATESATSESATVSSRKRQRISLKEWSSMKASQPVLVSRNKTRIDYANMPCVDGVFWVPSGDDASSVDSSMDRVNVSGIIAVVFLFLILLSSIQPFSYASSSSTPDK